MRTQGSHRTSGDPSETEKAGRSEELREDQALQGPEEAQPEVHVPLKALGCGGCHTRGGQVLKPYLCASGSRSPSSCNNRDSPSQPRRRRAPPAEPGPDPAGHSRSPTPTNSPLTRARSRRGSGIWASPSTSRRPRRYI